MFSVLGPRNVYQVNKTSEILLQALKIPVILHLIEIEYFTKYLVENAVNSISEPLEHAPRPPPPPPPQDARFIAFPPPPPPPPPCYKKSSYGLVNRNTKLINNPDDKIYQGIRRIKGDSTHLSAPICSQL